MAKPLATSSTEPAPPLFAQVASQLRSDILERRLAAGDKLPSELELEALFGVSRITVRQALAALEAQGLIVKINGKGSFVTRPREAPRLGPLGGFYEHTRARGDVAGGRTLSVREGKASQLVAESLNLEEGAPVTVISVVRVVNGSPIACGTLLAEPAMARDLLAEDLDTHDVMAVLESSLGFRLRSTYIEATAVAAGKLRGRLLEVAPSAPLLRIRFTPHDVSGRPLIYSELFFRPDRFTYRAVIKR